MAPLSSSAAIACDYSDLCRRSRLQDYGAKYPLTSRIRSVRFVAKALTDPSELAGTIAALATMDASNEFNVDTNGCTPPEGQSVRYCKEAGGTTVAFNAYAFAPAGIPHVLA